MTVRTTIPAREDVGPDILDRITVEVAPRRGLSRDEAARYVGIGTTKFDEMVEARTMPKPFAIGARVLWDIRDLDMAIDALKEGVAGNPWDGVR